MKTPRGTAFAEETRMVAQRAAMDFNRRDVMNRVGTSLGYETESHTNTVTVVEAEECLVSDDRAGLTPAEHVERKLVALLRSTPLRVSQLQHGRERRSLS
jgi:hypothetical protein